MAMCNPSHPGRIIRQRLIEDEDGQKIGSVASVPPNSSVATAIP